jgi:hypothetical protein
LDDFRTIVKIQVMLNLPNVMHATAYSMGRSPQVLIEMLALVQGNQTSKKRASRFRGSPFEVLQADWL